MSICRRSFVAGLLPAALIHTDCGSSSPSILKRLDGAEMSFGVSILNPFSLQAFTHRNGNAGHLHLLGYDAPLFALSLDGRNVAWVPRGSVLNSLATEIDVSVMLSVGLVEEIAAVAQFAIRIAISGDPGNVLLLSQDATRVRLHTINYVSSSHVTNDLTHLLIGVDLREVERLNISNNCGVLVAGTAGYFRVLETLSGKIIFEGEGRYPAVNPQGSSLAFVDRKRRLNLRDLRSGRCRILLRWTAIHGIGAWHPDGVMLLAGNGGFIEGSLYAVATDTDEYCRLATLSEGDYGDRFAWVSNSLLSKAK